MNYRLSKECYKRVIWTIKDYPRRKAQYEAILESSTPPPDGQPKGTTTGDPTGRKAMQAAEISREISAIEGALEKIPTEYQKGIFNFIVYRVPFPADASEMTYKRWKKKFIYYVAVRLGIVEVEA